jgi:hypothetical protein
MGRGSWGSHAFSMRRQPLVWEPELAPRRLGEAKLRLDPSPRKNGERGLRTPFPLATALARMVNCRNLVLD